MTRKLSDETKAFNQYVRALMDYRFSSSPSEEAAALARVERWGERWHELWLAEADTPCPAECPWCADARRRPRLG